jgi:hypothetical protein
MFKDSGAMPENLRRHIRYPEDIFTVQAEMYGTYHMTNPTTFYNREDRWEIPHQLYRNPAAQVAEIDLHLRSVCGLVSDGIPEADYVTASLPQSLHMAWTILDVNVGSDLSLVFHEAEIPKGNVMVI